MVSPSLNEVRTGKTPASKDVARADSTQRSNSVNDCSSGHSRGFRIPKLSFSGKGWKRFVTQFETVADRLGWSEEEKLDAFSLALTKDAAEYYSVLPDTKKSDYAWLKGKFDEYYEDLGPPSSLRWELLSVEQREDETLKRCMAHLQKMIIRAYPESETRQLSNPMFVETFLKGCRDKAAALNACDKDLKTIEEAYKQVKLAGQHRKAILGKKGSVRLVAMQSPNLFASSDSDDSITHKTVCQVRGVNKLPSDTTKESETSLLLKRLESIENLVKGKMQSLNSPGRYNFENLNSKLNFYK